MKSIRKWHHIVLSYKYESDDVYTILKHWCHGTNLYLAFLSRQNKKQESENLYISFVRVITFWDLFSCDRDLKVRTTFYGIRV